MPRKAVGKIMSDATKTKPDALNQSRQVGTLNQASARIMPGNLSGLKPTAPLPPTNGNSTGQAMPSLPEIVVSFPDLNRKKANSAVGHAATSEVPAEPAKEELGTKQAKSLAASYPSDAETIDHAASRLQNEVQRKVLADMVSTIDRATTAAAATQKTSPPIKQTQRQFTEASNQADTIPGVLNPPKTIKASAPQSESAKQQDDIREQRPASKPIEVVEENVAPNATATKSRIELATESLVQALYQEDDSAISDSNGSQPIEPEMIEQPHKSHAEDRITSEKMPTEIKSLPPIVETKPPTSNSIASNGSTPAVEAEVATKSDQSSRRDVATEQTEESIPTVPPADVSKPQTLGIAQSTIEDQGEEPGTEGVSSAKNGLASDKHAEQYQQLVTTLMDRTSEFGSSVLLFTSSAGEIESASVVQAIAQELAARDSNDRVLLIDGQFKRKGMTTFRGQLNKEGLAESINQGANWEKQISETDLPNLDFLPAGTGILSYRKSSIKRINRLSHHWKQKYRFVLVDAGESNSALARLWCPYCEATYLIFTLGETERFRARTAVTELQSFGARIMGCVVTEAESTQPRRARSAKRSS